MDFLKARQYKEWALVGLVGLATLFALLPAEIADQLSINRGYIAAILGIPSRLVVFAAFSACGRAQTVKPATCVTCALVVETIRLVECVG